jgi:peptidoglycan L-alanyl-D-glutamate endopeptidase CwlK
MSKYNLGNTSKSRLTGVHPDIAKVVNRAIQITTQDFMVLEGVRSKEQCYINWGKGRSAATLIEAGVPHKYAQPNMSKVTWLRNPLSSKHCLQKDGYGHAVDLVPYPVDWNTLSKFDAIGKAMMTAAKELNVSIRWGADWDRDGKLRERGESDSPHFEI